MGRTDHPSAAAPAAPTTASPIDHLDDAAAEIRELTTVRADRVRLAGDGWLDVTGHPDDVRAVTRRLQTAPFLASELRSERPGAITVRFALADNHHAFPDL